MPLAQIEQKMQSGGMQSTTLRRAVTPSPEKLPMGSTRRAITPTPNRNNIQMGDYQNLSVIQSKIFNGAVPNADTQMNQQQYQNLNVIQDKIYPLNGSDVVDGIRSINKDAMLNQNAVRKQQMNLQRSLSAESTQLQDGLSIPDHLNQPRRRDSGNWSGDRNSASSSSSTTLEGSYLYLMGKRTGSHPSSPTRCTQNGLTAGQMGVNGMPAQQQQQFFDAGYDSYSLSSTDSYPPKLHNPQLAKIPESVVLSGDCERLCMEADQLLEKSRYSEDMHDLEGALLLCNTAAGKARAAMDAPYSNPHTMTFARMKHNTCVMRARSLHRRILIERPTGDIQHSSNSLRHMRQNSRDGLSPATKSIEIYATLPKKGKSPLKLIDAEDIIAQDIQPLPVQLPQPKPERESRSLNIFGRGRRSNEEKEKRSRSEDRNKLNKHAREFTVAGEPLLANAKDTLKKHKEDKDDKIEKDKSNKKQHKIRRKILMGGLIRRKNRSMPDLTEANVQETEGNTSTKVLIPIKTAVDDSSLGLSATDGSPNGSAMSGYLSEGHFEYQTIITGNPSLERSKLMRKNMQNGVAMRQQLTQVKIPPPPPIRTNSTLSQQQLQLHQQQMEKELHTLPVSSIQPFHQANVSLISNMSSNTSMSEDSVQTIITTCAVVHQEQSPLQKQQQKQAQQTDQLNKYQSNQQDSVDEVDCRYEINLDLPPYPSPPTSTCHSRQASEDFPPPPSNTELLEAPVILDTQAQRRITDVIVEDTTSILAQLQQRIKQQKTKTLENPSNAIDQQSVKDLASRFEQIKIPYGMEQSYQAQIRMQRAASSSQEVLANNITGVNQMSKPQIRTNMNGLLEPDSRVNTPSVMSNDSGTTGSYDEVDCVPKSMQNSDVIKSASAPHLAPAKPSYELTPSLIAEEMREVEMLNNVMHQTLNQFNQNGTSSSNSSGNNNNNNNPTTKQFQSNERAKKKSVSFCDQVILVATADDDEEDDFIPNPILQRVLRTGGAEIADNRAMQQQQNQMILRLQNEPTPRQQTIIPLQGSVGNDCNNNEVPNHRNDMKNPQHQPQRPLNTIVHTNQMPYDQDGVTSNSAAPNRILQMNGSIPTQNNIGHAQNEQQIQAQLQRTSMVYHHIPVPMQSQVNPQIITQHIMAINNYDSSHIINNPTSPYIQIPTSNVNYTKVQRPQIYPFVPNASQQNQYIQSSKLVAQSGVYHTPPQPKYMQPPQNVSTSHLQSHPQHFIPNGTNFPISQVINQNNVPLSPYQRVPIPHKDFVLQDHQAIMANQLKQQRVTTMSPHNATISSSVPAKTTSTKKVSFEPGTKGESECHTNETVKPNGDTMNGGITNNINNNSNDTSQMTVTAIPTRVFNNSAIVKASAKAVQCNLCRKKHVIAPSVYCSDCEFYMSRFKPRI